MDYLITQIVICLLLAFLLGCIIGWLLKRVSARRQEQAHSDEITRLRGELERLEQSLRSSDPAPAAAAASAAPSVASNASASPELGLASGVAAAGAAAVATGAAAAEQASDTVQDEVESVAAKASVSASSASGALASAGDSATDPADLESSYDIEEIEGIGPGYGRRLRGLGVETTLDLLNRCEDGSQVAAIAEEIGIEQFVVNKWLSMADLLRIPGIRGQFAELLGYAGVQSVADLSGRAAGALAGELKTLNDKENRTKTVPSSELLASWIEAAERL